MAAGNAGLSDDDALALADAGHAITDDLCAAAAELRDRGKGRIVTFSPKVFIPLTRLCRDFCGYCTFRQSPDPGGRPLSFRRTRRFPSPSPASGWAAPKPCSPWAKGRSSAMPRPATGWRNAGIAHTQEYLAAMCRLVFDETDLLPHGNPGTMSRRELMALQPTNPSVGIMLESSSPRLYETGGPHEFAPSKRPRVRLRTMELAGELGIPFTTGILIGIGETRRERVASLLAIRRLSRPLRTYPGSHHPELSRQAGYAYGPAPPTRRRTSCSGLSP